MLALYYQGGWKPLCAVVMAMGRQEAELESSRSDLQRPVTKATVMAGDGAVTEWTHSYAVVVMADCPSALDRSIVVAPD